MADKKQYVVQANSLGDKNPEPKDGEGEWEYGREYRFGDVVDAEVLGDERKIAYLLKIGAIREETEKELELIGLINDKSVSKARIDKEVFQFAATLGRPDINWNEICKNYCLRFSKTMWDNQWYPAMDALREASNKASLSGDGE